MKRFLIAVLALAATASIVLAPSQARAGVNDFVISDFRVDYHLSRDAGNRSHLKTVERITAQFPSIDQNHGIERAIPKSYDGHSTSLSVESVKRADGQAWKYTTIESNDNLVLRIGDADTYVHGAQTYVITYTERDVTRYFADRNDDEFYWDTNGTEWLVPISQVSARVHVDGSLSDYLNGDEACYIGAVGSGEQCTVTASDEDGATVLSATSQRSLQAGENITLAIGFKPQTFAPYEPSLAERLGEIWVILTVITAVAGLALTIWLSVKLYRINNRSGEMGTIVPEYLSPRDASVTAASQVVNTPLSVMTAQLLDLAVRHYLKIYEVSEKSLFKAAEYELEIVKDISDLRWEEKELLEDIFGGTVAVGQRINLKTLQGNTGFYKRTINNDTDLQKLVRGEYALREKRPENVSWFRRTSLILLILGILLLSIPLLFVALMAFIFSFAVWSLTDKGLALRRYLEGLKLYIKVAEQERIAMLQSPEGAAKIGTAIDGNQRQLVTLYEKVLPYAVLFGQEKQWNKQLGAYYEKLGSQPDWYSGHSGVFNAAVFTSAMNSFSASTTYASSSSSSSSGSGGGGSSGGGGGGGGGGGW